MTELRTAPHPAVADVSVAAVAYLGAVAVVAGPSLPVGGGALLAVGAGAAVLTGAGANLLGRAVPSCTPADRVTLARAVLVACCAALTASGLLTGGPSGLPLLAVGTAAFALDAVDGPVARRTGTASADGARLDTATDAALTLVLACAVAGSLGVWALGSGLLYYVFQATGRVRPSLRAPLPPSAARKVIGALQPAALLFALVPGIPGAAATAAVAAALGLLVLSFGRDVVVLEQRRVAAG